MLLFQRIWYRTLNPDKKSEYFVHTYTSAEARSTEYRKEKGQFQHERKKSKIYVFTIWLFAWYLFFLALFLYMYCIQPSFSIWLNRRIVQGFFFQLFELSTQSICFFSVSFILFWFCYYLVLFSSFRMPYMLLFSCEFTVRFSSPFSTGNLFDSHPTNCILSNQQKYAAIQFKNPIRLHENCSHSPFYKYENVR